MFCCCSDELKVDASEGSSEKFNFRDITTHPSDSSIALTRHQPLYPPGKIIHIVRNHPRKEEQIMNKRAPVYQALWAENTDFDEVLISPVMVQDHMPDKVLDALNELLVNIGPAKPQRQFLSTGRCSSCDSVSQSETPLHRVVLETSFTDLQPGIEEPTSLPSKTVGLIGASDKGVGSSAENASACATERKEWAPLASPETLSDISSISSRGSQQKPVNGNQTTWTGIPVMEPIAQSPAAQRLYSESERAYPSYSIQVEANSEPDDEMYQTNCKVVTKATIEVNPPEENNCSEHVIDPSQLCLNIGGLEKNLQESNCRCAKFGTNSAYGNTGAEQTIEKLFTLHEPRRVTFDLYEKQKIAREISEDSMYNSGESFVPTYPEYGNQQEYGNHGYMYTSCGYNSLSPASSPIIEHSVSDAQLFKLIDEPFIHRIHERIRSTTKQT